MIMVYRKYENFIEKILFPLVLLGYPLLKINQGLDVADTTYSLANFQYFGQMKGTWMVATFLANAVGSLFMRLPFGDTLIGMNFYTALVQSAAAIMVYLALRKRIPGPVLFLGEMLALGLCWCPGTILYNYLTYFLLTAGILFLYFGLTAPVAAGADGSFGMSGRRQGLYFAAAGLCLGANVAVRMPNVVQAALILAVWYGIVLRSRDKKGGVADRYGMGMDTMGAGGSRASGNAGAGSLTALPWWQLVQATLWCLGGYAAGFGIPFAVICVRYGFSAYPDMVRTMFAMTEQAADYKPASMLTGMFGDYLTGLYWLIFAGVCMAAGALAFILQRKCLDGQQAVSPQKHGRWNANKITSVIFKAAYSLLFLVLLRFYWGRGMFTFHYYEHDCRSIYYITVLFLLVTICFCIDRLFRKKARREQKILAALVLLEIFLTPLGSNNKLYPIINNLFLAVPFTLWAARDVLFSKARAVVGGIPFVMLTVFLFAQSIGFHGQFVFQDGIWGEPRDRKVEVPAKAAGVYTNLENGTLLEELSLYAQEEGFPDRKLIAYGEMPGLSYLLDMPPALSTAWPDLASYRMAEYKRDLAAVEADIAAGEEPPAIILSASAAANLSDDGEAINWFGVDTEAMAADEKLHILSQFMQEYGYRETFGNARYVVYVAF